jgi:hypothetical protein
MLKLIPEFIAFDSNLVSVHVCMRSILQGDLHEIDRMIKSSITHRINSSNCCTSGRAS